MRTKRAFALPAIAISIIALLATRTAPDRGRCVGMILAPNPAGPSPRGPYRVFEDGTVEFLALPMPPCPGGHYDMWIAFPN